ncbi:MAG: hypothetical protein IJX28_05555 [Clostridia bacterium]|nr:hypothetical protein [Clostridia bacterium]
MRDLLLFLDQTLNTKGKVIIDVKGTDMELVRSAGCVHCGRSIPIDLPKKQYSMTLAERCGQCAETVAHSYDADISFYKFTTQYSLKAARRVLSTPLRALWFDYQKEFLALGCDGIVHRCVLVP